MPSEVFSPAPAAFTQASFDYICKMVYDHSGIALGADKHYLVQLRIAPLAKAAGHSNIDAFVGALQRGPVNGHRTSIVEAMTTNETSFFRDLSPFEALRQHLLPELVKKRGTQPIRIWCGACSTGQEPYSIAMIIHQHFRQLVGRVQIVATDLANTVLTIAKAGRYSQFEVNRGLPAPLLIKYFEQVGNEWHLSDEIKRMVTFQPMNLVSAWPLMDSFDLVFLRNVMIYFTVETKREILRKIRGVLRKDGHLFLGSSETTMGLDNAFQRVSAGKAICYGMGAAPESTASTPRPAMTTPVLAR
ncbi:MAG: protein-glutamate O-methyltransferase CheR [Chthoniobacteraceae bacterium]